MKYNYPKLKGICKISIETGLCTGCQKLENINFTGVQECKYIKNPREQIKRILEIGVNKYEI